MKSKDIDIIDSFDTEEFKEDMTIYEEEYKPLEDEEEYNKPAQDEETDRDEINESHESNLENTADTEMIIYLVTDRPVAGLINYFRECGVAISNIYTSIVEARNAILMQSEPCRIVISDTGLGKFTTTQTRQELIDMIGICDESNKVTVFYADSVIKMDTIRELGKDKLGIDWFKYYGTADMAATILKYGEKYKLDFSADDEDELVTEKEVGEIKGLNSKVELGEPVVSGVSAEHIIKNILESTEDCLPKYKITI